MISTHVLDTSEGIPAVGITVDLEMKSGGHWNLLATEKTNADGRIAFSCAATAGQYRMQFYTSDYFSAKKRENFYPLIPVIFQISDESRKYHVPLLLNPFGYSTYRGS